MYDQYGGVPGVFDYKTQPLGSLPGEGHLAQPYNLVPDRVLVRVRNLSASMPRNVIKEAVSIRRGGNEQLKDKTRMATFGDRISPVELQFRVAQGDNMNWTDQITEGVDYILRHGGQRFLIPYSEIDPKTKQHIPNGALAPWMPVPAGAWDLYMGNWDAMNSRDQKDKTDELSRLRLRYLSHWTIQDEQGYGFLEFAREVIQVETVAVDEQMLAAGRLIEV